jgi:hypothetical protein
MKKGNADVTDLLLVSCRVAYTVARETVSLACEHAYIIPLEYVRDIRTNTWGYLGKSMHEYAH